ncbi:MAG: thiamine-phosphate kinase [Myxococcota bacterium]
MNEFALIDRFVACFDVQASPAGPGDDCAVLRRQGPSCVTTDALVEGVHFTRATFSPEDIGHKALAVNLSDLAAMGARPTWFTVALGLPPAVTTAELVRIGRSMAALARRHGARLVGGNVTRAAELSLTITAAGALSTRPLLRSGARPGDLIFVSGTLGDAAGGLRALRDGLAAPQLVRAQRRPHPHLAFAARARALVTAAIDVSDGLAQDLSHVCVASHVGADLHSAALPLSRALVDFAGADALELALRGGEDYVLLVTAPARSRARLRSLGAFEIGVVTRETGLTLDGKPLSGPLGFQHRS